MSFPTPLINGSITFLVLTLFGVFGGYAARLTGKLDKENAMYVELLVSCVWDFNPFQMQ